MMNKSSSCNPTHTNENTKSKLKKGGGREKRDKEKLVGMIIIKE